MKLILSQADTRRRQEEEELQRVLELSKQDKGGRNTYQSYNPPAPSTQGSGSSSRPQQQNSIPSSRTNQPLPPPPIAEPEVIPDLNSATRVRALYAFVSAEVGELNFERGDVIKVLDRGFKEWWRGACNGKIGVSCPGLRDGIRLIVYCRFSRLRMSRL
jgi:signal transducing adaptor molecule